jgi:hypothetical protein
LRRCGAASCSRASGFSRNHTCSKQEHVDGYAFLFLDQQQCRAIFTDMDRRCATYSHPQPYLLRPSERLHVVTCCGAMRSGDEAMQVPIPYSYIQHRTQATIGALASDAKVVSSLECCSYYLGRLASHSRGKCQLSRRSRRSRSRRQQPSPAGQDDTIRHRDPASMLSFQQVILSCEPVNFMSV